MLLLKHMEIGSNNQRMNRMIAQVIPVRKMWYFSGKFDQHLSLYCGSVKPKLQMGPGRYIFFRS